MPIYHFEVRRSGQTFNDEEGLFFDDMDGAWREATRAAGVMVKDLNGKLVVGSACSIEVQDESYNCLRTVNIMIGGPKC